MTPRRHGWVLPLTPLVSQRSPKLRNARVVRGVIHPATLFRVPHVRLRREEEDAIQRGMSAPRELPEARSVEIFPRPVRITPARFRRPMTAAEAFGHLRSDVSHLADEGIDL